MATLRRYCVHSTLVPVVVPIFVPPHDWEIHMKELLLSNGRVLDGKRGKRGTRLAKILHPEVGSFFFFKSPAPAPLESTFLSPLCLSIYFWALNFFGVARILQCRTSPVGTDYNRTIELSVLPLFHASAMA